jgi:hypothetical protein
MEVLGAMQCSSKEFRNICVLGRYFLERKYWKVSGKTTELWDIRTGFTLYHG